MTNAIGSINSSSGGGYTPGLGFASVKDFKPVEPVSFFSKNIAANPDKPAGGVGPENSGVPGLTSGTRGKLDIYG